MLMKSNYADSINSKGPNYTFRNHGIQYTSSMGGIHFVWSNAFCVYRDVWSVSLFFKQ